mmetsp:Transcript_987/g.1409  ORF Transcript_987/g.1409 Transcript_987/m.1409 type:complete len:337 (+) Transcript_987:1131-2141(+)
MLVNSANNCGHYNREHHIISRSFVYLFNVEKVNSVSSCDRPVIVFSTSVYVVEWFLLEKSSKSKFRSNFLDNLHNDNVLIDLCGDGSKERSELILVWSNLTVTSTKRNSKLEALALDLCHTLKSRAGSGRRSHIVVAHLLSTWSILSNNSTSSKLEVRSSKICFTRDEENFLLESNVSLKSGDIPAQERHQTLSFTVQCIHRAEKRSLLVECVSVVGNKARWNENSIPSKPDVRSRVDFEISSSCVGSTKTTIWIRRPISFSRKKILSFKVPNCGSITIELEESVLNLPRKTVSNSRRSHRLEPMAKRGSSIVNSPIEHCMCNFVRSCGVFRPFGF